MYRRAHFAIELDIDRPGLDVHGPARVVEEDCGSDGVGPRAGRLAQRPLIDEIRQTARDGEVIALEVVVAASQVFEGRRPRSRVSSPEPVWSIVPALVTVPTALSFGPSIIIVPSLLNPESSPCRQLMCPC